MASCRGGAWLHVHLECRRHFSDFDAEEATLRSPAGLRARKDDPNNTTIRRALKGATFKGTRKETRWSDQGQLYRPRSRTQAVDQQGQQRVRVAFGAASSRPPAPRSSTAPPLRRTRRRRARHSVDDPPLEAVARSRTNANACATSCVSCQNVSGSWAWTRTSIQGLADPAERPWAEVYEHDAGAGGQLRKKGEGLSQAFTNSDQKEHCANTGGRHCQVLRRDHRLQGTRMTSCSSLAKKVYDKGMAPALKRHRGQKRSYILLEDNDPTGFKPKAGVDVKVAFKIQRRQVPASSPDLNTPDFPLGWSCRGCASCAEEKSSACVRRPCPILRASSGNAGEHPGPRSEHSREGRWQHPS